MTDDNMVEEYHQKFKELLINHNCKPEDYRLTFNLVPDIKPNHLWRFRMLFKENKYYASKLEIIFAASIHKEKGHVDFWKAVENELVSKLKKEELEKQAFSDVKKENENK